MEEAASGGWLHPMICLFQIFLCTVLLVLLMSVYVCSVYILGHQYTVVNRNYFFLYVGLCLQAVKIASFLSSAAQTIQIYYTLKLINQKCPSPQHAYLLRSRKQREYKITLLWPKNDMSLHALMN